MHIIMDQDGKSVVHMVIKLKKPSILRVLTHNMVLLNALKYLHNPDITFEEDNAWVQKKRIDSRS